MKEIITFRNGDVIEISFGENRKYILEREVIPTLPVYENLTYDQWIVKDLLGRKYRPFFGNTKRYG